MRLLPALVLLVCSACPAWAQVEAPSRLRLTWENDLFAGRDAHYTNGAAVALSGRLDPGLLPGLLYADRAEWELEVGQQIYTPEDTATADPAPGARPYAGYAYLSLGVLRRHRRRALQDRITLTLGLVGPTSGAEAAHELAHDLTGSSPAEGWAHQLRDEPTFGISYALSQRLARAHAFGLDADITADVEVALGSVSTHASAGGTLRFGFNVPDEYSAPTLALLRCHLTAGFQLRAVAYDIFLDGNLLRSGGPRVRKRPLAAEASLGLTITVSDRVSLSYVHTYRTPQFDGQRTGDQFGSLSLVVAW